MIMKVIARWLVIVLMLLAANIVHAGKLSDDNLNEFLLKYGADFSAHTERLFLGFVKYRAHDDYQGFGAFKDKEWLPDYDRDKRVYEDILADNRVYLTDNGLTWLFDDFSELTSAANALWNDIKLKDKSIRRAQHEKLKMHLLRVQELFAKRGLKTRSRFVF
jgi:hypothetical protein